MPTDTAADADWVLYPGVLPAGDPSSEWYDPAGADTEPEFPVDDTPDDLEPEHSVWAVVTTDDQGRKSYRIPHGGRAGAERVAREVCGVARLFTGKDTDDLYDLQDAAAEVRWQEGWEASHPYDTDGPI